MKWKTLFVVLLSCFAAVRMAAQKHQQPEIKIYELYSWQDEKGGWMFSLLPAIISIGFDPPFIMRPANTIPGVNGLKAKMKRLPEESEIVWLDHATGAGKNLSGWDRIKIPTTDVVEKVRQFCEEKHIKLSIEATKK